MSNTESKPRVFNVMCFGDSFELRGKNTDKTLYMEELCLIEATPFVKKAVENHAALLSEIQISVDRFKPDHCVTCINYEDPMRCDCGEHDHLKRMKEHLKASN